MIRVEIRLDRRGVLKGFSVSGHAGSGPKGEDLVCAAVSNLFRSAARLLALQREIRILGSAPEGGELELHIEQLPPARRQWLSGITDVLIQGARDLEEETPGSITVRIVEGED